MRPTRGLGSAPLPRRSNARVAPSYLALLRVEFAAFHSVAGRSRRHRHCGTGPRLTADGRYPLPCAAELGLSSRRAGCPAERATIRPPRWPADSRPPATAAGRPPRRRATATPGRPPATRSMRLVGEARRPPSSGPAARASRSSAGSPPSVALASAQSGCSLASLTRQRPLSCSTISFESRSRSTFSRAQLAGQLERPHDARRTRPRCWSGRPGTRRSWRRGRRRGSQRVGPRAVDQDRARARPGPGCRAPRRRSG